MEFRATEARGTHSYGERGGLLPRRLAARFRIRRSDSQAVGPALGHADLTDVWNRSVSGPDSVASNSVTFHSANNIVY
jgi:hypothetical protein